MHAPGWEDGVDVFEEPDVTQQRVDRFVLPPPRNRALVEIKARARERFAALEHGHPPIEAGDERVDTVSLRIGESHAGPRESNGIRGTTSPARLGGLHVGNDDVDELAPGAAPPDDQAVLGQRSAKRVDIDAVHPRKVSDLVIIERLAALAQNLQNMVAATEGHVHQYEREVHIASGSTLDGCGAVGGQGVLIVGSRGVHPW